MSRVLPLEQKLRNKTAVIGVIGLGYVGLPLAIAFARAGFKVLGFDVQQGRVAAVNRGESYIIDVTNRQLAGVVARGRLEATTEQARLAEPDAICICVPTPLSKTKEPDLFYVTSEAEEVAKHLRRGQLVVLESTTYPGTTREVVLPRLKRSGLKVGRDFFLGYSPERVDPGNKKYNIENTPKLVGGIDAESTRMVAALYGQIVTTVVPVSSPEVAEITKIFENVFRNVNIALVNELSSLCEKMGISVWEVVDAAATKPFGYMPFYPGPGVGGHCIPKDPYYLSSKAREFDFHTRFIELAAEINERMPERVVSKIIEILSLGGKGIRGARVLVLGATFKRDVEDMRDSPSLKVINHLLAKGAAVSYNDPYVPEIKVAKGTLASKPLTEKALATADCVVIATDHSGYDYQYIIDKAVTLFDTRGVTRKYKGGKTLRLGESDVSPGSASSEEA